MFKTNILIVQILFWDIKLSAIREIFKTEKNKLDKHTKNRYAMRTCICEARWKRGKSKPVAGSQFLGGGGTIEKFSKGKVFIV